MTGLQEQKYHAAIQVILAQKLTVNAHVYLVDNGDVWLRFTQEVEAKVDGHRLYCLLTILA